MARMHTRRKGQSGSRRPSTLRVPEWIDKEKNADWVETKVIELAKAGNTPSMIGMILRDQYGIPLVRTIAGKRIMDILRENELERQVPEDLRNMIARAARIRRHLEENKKDFVSKRGLQLVESKIHRLSKYYKRKRVLPADWKYTPERAAVLLR
ncbi:MAG: 30S ribosomal protein S15 [Candidatus Thorarchaeota archaeon]|nr:MAG: 30S ribosomal protein S15 [Candidatus Thorarchaeota archaeon]